MTATSSTPTPTASRTPSHSQPSPAAATIEASPAQVQQWLRNGEAILIDVREPDEHARERIGGARLMPLSKFDPGRAGALAAPGQRIVLHCRSGRRSAEACRLAATTGGRHATFVNMTGGIEAWKQSAQPVEVDTRVSGISVMRQVQLVIGVGVLAGSVLGWLVDPLFIGLAAFFGAGLVFAGATGTCGLATLLSRMPWNRAAACGSSCSGGACGKP